jgi:multisubunit Na+/H+ antiporter MnhC subunit
MHLNKLSTAALMRLTILASLNLIMGRLVGSWMILLHPLFFLMMVTLDLGLYALMVYSGTLNKTLIGMMLAGLAGVLLTIAYGGAGADTFGWAGHWQDVTESVDSLILWIGQALSLDVDRSTPFYVRWRGSDRVILCAYIIVDVLGLILIAAGGLSARALQARSRPRDNPAPPPPLDAGAASPL